LTVKGICAHSIGNLRALCIDRSEHGLDLYSYWYWYIDANGNSSAIYAWGRHSSCCPTRRGARWASALSALGVVWGSSGNHVPQFPRVPARHFRSRHFQCLALSFSSHRLCTLATAIAVRPVPVTLRASCHLPGGRYTPLHNQDETDGKESGREKGACKNCAPKWRRTPLSGRVAPRVG